MNSKTNDTNSPVFLPTCLNCGASMEKVEDWGGAMQGGSCDCPHCGEQHSYLIEDGVLILQRVSVPIGHVGLEVEKTFRHHSGGGSLKSEEEKLGADLRQYNREEEDEILEAVSSGQIPLAFMLYREKYGGTAQEAKAFIDDLRGANGNNMTERQTIQEAVEKTNISKSDALLGTKPGFLTSTDSHGCTPLHLAVQSHKPELVERLLASGAEVNAKDVKGWTPLHFAAANGSVVITQLLLANGAGAAMTSIDGNTPENLAQQGLVYCSRSELTSMLKKDYSDVLAVLQSTSSNSSAGCFIATACYGSPDCREVGTLRQFRDRVMAPFPFGRFLISVYYWLSPPIARLLIRHVGLRGCARNHIVQPIVKWIERKIERSKRL